MALLSHLALVPRLPPVSDMPGDDGDRRSDRRLLASELSWLNGVRLKYGPVVSVIDLSSGGIQIETADCRIQPGATVVLDIGIDDGTITVPGSVVRCRVAGVAPRILYRSGLAFKRAIALPRMGAKEPDAAGEDAYSLHAQARFSLALRRRAEAAAGAHSDGLVAPPRSGVVDGGASAAALAIMNSTAAKRAGRVLGRELAGLFEEAAIALEEGLASDDICEQLVCRLRRVVPATMIRLATLEHARYLLTAEPFYFDVRSGPGDEDRRLLIDLSPSSPLAEWHFMYLKAAAQVLSAISQLRRRDVDTTRVTADAKDAPRAVADSTLALRPGWHKVVVRHTDGHILKGYARDFTASSRALDLLASPDAPQDTRISVPLAHLKAVFFVRDFEGDPSRIDGSGTVERGHGRRIVVTFLDGENLSGTTLACSPDAAGFFIRPDDGGSNNIRVFIVRGSVRHIQWA